MKTNRVYKCVKTSLAAMIALDYPEVSDSGQVIKDVVLECSKAFWKVQHVRAGGKLSRQTDRH